MIGTIRFATDIHDFVINIFKFLKLLYLFDLDSTWIDSRFLKKERVILLNVHVQYRIFIMSRKEIMTTKLFNKNQCHISLN